MLQASQLRGALIPAVPVPFREDGRMDDQAQARYAAWLAGQPIAGVAVWAHTGRGLRLEARQRAAVAECCRKALADPLFLVAAAGGAAGATAPAEVFRTAREMARQAAQLGADALLVHPPSMFREHPERDSLILEYHHEVAREGLPLLLFYLYEQAGGVSYGSALLARLLAMPQVLGIKVATLDSVMTFQEIARQVLEQAPGKVLITGEDRFLGYSLMCGAEAALIGMGAACTTLQAALLRSHREGRLDRFMSLNRAVDDLGRHTFRAPMEGYIRRMLWCLVRQGVITSESAHDPWGPDLDPDQSAALGKCLDRIEAELGTLEPQS